MEDERDVEQYLIRKVKEIGGKSWKWVSPGTAGVPDRICVLPEGNVWFVEVKRPGGRQSVQQKLIRKTLLDLGCNSAVVYGKKGVDTWLRYTKAGTFDEF